MHKEMILKFFFLKFLFTFHVRHVNCECQEAPINCEAGCYWGGSIRSCGKGCGDVYICEEVGPGYYSGIENPRYECLIGTYAPLNKNEQCTSCEPGTYQDLQAQSECKTCLEGTYQPDFAQSSCLNCPPGSYSDSTSSTSCQPCSDEVYSGEGSTTFYVDTDGNKICILSPAMIPSSVPTQILSSSPSSLPTLQPSTYSSNLPSFTLSSIPTLQPSIIPSGLYSSQPSIFPTAQPSIFPSSLPSFASSSYPTVRPSTLPTLQSSLSPSLQPSYVPSLESSSSPTVQPSIIPSLASSSSPTMQPSIIPSLKSSSSPSTQPSIDTALESSLSPTVQYSIFPTLKFSSSPTVQPSSQPTSLPSLNWSSLPTSYPSINHTYVPSSFFSSLPTLQTSINPSQLPSSRPSLYSTLQSSLYPSSLPSSDSSSFSTLQHSKTPSYLPSSKPSFPTTLLPSIYPSSFSSSKPSLFPTMQISIYPSALPSSNRAPFPTFQPSIYTVQLPVSSPASFPSLQPSLYSSNSPLSHFSTSPTLQASLHTSNLPSLEPSSLPTLQTSAYSTGIPSDLSTLKQPVKEYNMPSSAPSLFFTLRPSSYPVTSTSMSTLYPTSDQLSKLSTKPTLSTYIWSSIPSQTSAMSSPSLLPSISSQTRDIFSSSRRECEIGYTGSQCNECCDVNHRMVNDDEGIYIYNTDCLVSYDKSEQFITLNVLSSKNIGLPKFSNFFRQGKGRGQNCVQCPKHSMMVITLFLITIAAGMILLKKFATMNLSYGLMFLSIDYLQIVSFLNVTMVQWPENVIRIFTLLSVFRFDNVFTAPECKFAIDYFGNWISIMTFPMILFVLAHLLSIVMTFVRKRFFNTPRKNASSHMHQILGIMIVTLYFSYMKLTMTALEVFDCSDERNRVPSDELDSGNEFGATNDAESGIKSQYMSITNWVCFDKNSKQVVLLPFAAVAIFVYGIGFPLYLSNILLRKKNRRRAREDQILRAQNLGSTLETNRRCYQFRQCYGCIYSMYKPEFWYWVIVVLVKKLILIVLSMSFQYHPILQLCSIIMIVLIFSAVQFSCYPMMSLCKKDDTVEKYQFDVNRLQNEIIRHNLRPNASFDEAAFLHAESSVSSERNVPEIVRKSRMASDLQKKSRLLWDHNIVEVVLETTFVLICVLGIIFGSIEKKSKLYEFTSYFTLGVIAFSMIYLVVVLCSEVFFFHLCTLHWNHLFCGFTGINMRFQKSRIGRLYKSNKTIVDASVLPEGNNIEIDRYTTME